MASTSTKSSWKEVLGARLASRLDAECYRAVFETGEVTPAHAESFLDAVARLARDAEDEALSATIKRALIVIVAPHERVHPKLLTFLREECLKFGDTVSVLWCLGESALEMAVEWVAQADLSAKGAINAQTYFLGLIEKPLAREGLDFTYRNASWLELRVAWRKLSGVKDSGAIASLVRRAQSAAPNTQKEICDAIGRIGHPSGEPLLLALIRHADPGRTLAAAKALKIIGTRRALPALKEALETSRLPQYVTEALNEAIDVIVRREEVTDSPGAVTIANTGGEVALSDAGELALYRAVDEVVAAQSDEAWIPRENKDPWTQLIPPPRRVPLWVHLQMVSERLILMGTIGSTFGVGCVLLGGAGGGATLWKLFVEFQFFEWKLWGVLFGSFAMVFMGKPIVEVSLSIMREVYRDLAALRRGELTLATIVDYRSKTTRRRSHTFTRHAYRVRYLTPEGEIKFWKYNGLHGWGKLRKNDSVPLFLLGTDAVCTPLVYDCLKLREDGTLGFQGWSRAWKIPVFWGALWAQISLWVWLLVFLLPRAAGLSLP